MVIDLERAGDARRLRLRTNLEIYWDALRYAAMADAPVATQRLAMAGAEVVEGHHPMPGPQQRLAQMPADEAGRTGDQHRARRLMESVLSLVHVVTS